MTCQPHTLIYLPRLPPYLFSYLLTFSLIFLLTYLLSDLLTYLLTDSLTYLLTRVVQTVSSRVQTVSTYLLSHLPTVSKRSKWSATFEFFTEGFSHSSAARRSGKRLTRAGLLFMERQARPAPSHRLRCYCRAHRRDRTCRIFRTGHRWPHARAERGPQLLDVVEPVLQQDGAGKGPTTVVASGGLLVDATAGAVGCCG